LKPPLTVAILTKKPGYDTSKILLGILSRNPGWASKMLFRTRQAEAELLYVHKEDVVDVIDQSGNNTNPNISCAGSRKMGWHPAYCTIPGDKKRIADERR
jgi:hypothetical protein